MGSSFPRAASLAVALALGAALGSGPAQGNELKLNVSATILPRIACSTGASTTFRCSGTGPAYRVSSDAGIPTYTTDARGALTVTVKTAKSTLQPGTHADTAVLTIEP